jgi:hypothetical protein
MFRAARRLNRQVCAIRGRSRFDISASLTPTDYAAKAFNCYPNKFGSDKR